MAAQQGLGDLALAKPYGTEDLAHHFDRMLDLEMGAYAFVRQVRLVDRVAWTGTSSSIRPRGSSKHQTRLAGQDRCWANFVANSSQRPEDGAVRHPVR
jgi:hypothetical protein